MLPGRLIPLLESAAESPAALVSRKLSPDVLEQLCAQASGKVEAGKRAVLGKAVRRKWGVRGAGCMGRQLRAEGCDHRGR